MAKTTKVDILRRLIREEVAKAIRQEMPSIIKEIVSSSTEKPIIKESKKVKPTIPGTLNTQAFKPKPAFASKNPIASLLNETATNMYSQDDDFVSYNSDNLMENMGMANPMDVFQPKQVAVGDVNDMLATARPSSDPSMVQINAVPDFTELMSKMLAKGQM
jgi:hypothetical protein